MGLIRWVVNWYRDRCRKARNNFGRAMGWGGCHCCGNTYDWKPSYHNTEYSKSRGCIPMCEDCWKRSTIEQRKFYHMQLVDEWVEEVKTGDFYRGYTPEQKQKRIEELETNRLLIIAAVEAGK